jgi:hypothetical protein
MARLWNRTREVYEASFEKMTTEFEGGADETDIAARYGISGPTLGRWLTKAGYKHRGRGRYPLAMKARAAELHSRGWSLEAIANLLHVDRDFVDDWIREMPAPEPNPKKRKRAQELIDNPAWERHRRGRRWTEEQYKNVLDLIVRKFTVLEVFRIAGASKARQRMVWRSVGGKGPPPNLEQRRTQRRRRRRRRPGELEGPPKVTRRPVKRVLAPGGRREEPELGPAPPPKRKPLPSAGRPEAYEPGELPPAPKRRLPPGRRRALPEPEE